MSLQDISFHVVGMFFYALLARTLGELGLGTYSYVFAVVSFSSYFIDFGITTSYWRKWTTDRDSFFEEVREILGTKLVLCVITAIILFGHVLLFESSLFWYFVLVFIYHILEVLRSIPLFYLQAQNKFRTVFTINAIDRYGSLLPAILILFSTPHLGKILFVFILARLLSIMYAYSVARFPLKPSISTSNTLKTLKASSLLFFIQILSVLYFKIDTFLIKQILGLEAVGAYTAAYRILEALLIVPNIILFSLFAPLNQVVSDGNKAKISALISTMLKYTVLISGFIALFFWFYSEHILKLLYGSQFVDSTQVLQQLGLTTIFVFSNAVLVSLLLAKKRDTKLLLRSLGLSLFNIALNLTMLPRWGIEGASMSTLLTELIGSILLIILSWKYLVNSTQWLHKMLALFVGLGCVLAFFPLPLFPALVIFGMVYLVTAYSINILSVQELQQDDEHI